jgi:hypothetical protein
VRGYRFSLLLILARGGALTGLGAASSPCEAELAAIAGVPAYAVLYLSAPLWLSRGVLGALHLSAAGVRNVAVALLFAASVVPPFASMAMGSRANDALFNLLNPVLGSLNLLEGRLEGDVVPLLWAIALASAIAADRVLAHRDRRAT